MDKFNDLSRKKLLHNYHDAFYKLFRLPLDYIAPDNKTFTICGKAHCNALCARIMESEQGSSCCALQTAQRIAEAKRTGKPLVSSCHAGFYDAVVPIFVNDEYMGSLCVGQFLKQQPDAEKLKKICQELAFLDLQPAELESYCRQTRILSEEEIEGLIDLLQMLGEYICESYAKLRFFESMRSSNPILAAEQYIKSHYGKNLSVDGIARSVGMSKSYFIHKFTEQTGSSPVVYLNSYRIMQAAEMLLGTNLPISEIACNCGFRTISHFNKQFQKQFQQSPGTYRKLNTLSKASNV